MSHSLGPRISKGSGPSQKLKEYNVRKRAWPFLLVDFRERCAYSMRHLRIAGGESQMEVDHFDPTLRGAARNAYSNLMLATRHCNLRKRDYWPTQREMHEGFRLLNPCREIDYGEHLFEDPVTNHLVGATKAGRYHIDICDLNNDTFVWERRQRSRFLELKRESPALISGSFSEIQEMLDFIAGLVGLLIPEIPRPGERLLTDV